MTKRMTRQAFNELKAEVILMRLYISILTKRTKFVNQILAILNSNNSSQRKLDRCLAAAEKQVLSIEKELEINARKLKGFQKLLE